MTQDAAARAQAILDITRRLTEVVMNETARMEARQPLEVSDEKNRLVNAYRLEMARISQDRATIEDAPAPIMVELKQATEALHQAMAAHETALSALKLVAEGLVQAMAEEVARQRGAAPAYGSNGSMETTTGPLPTLIDRSA
jgi:hypothetical protein